MHSNPQYRACVSGLFVFVFVSLVLIGGTSPVLGQTAEMPSDDTADEAIADEAIADETVVDENEVVVQAPIRDSRVSVESAEHLSSGGARLLPDAVGLLPDEAEIEPQMRRRLIFVADGHEPLLTALGLQLPDWRVRQISARPTYLRIWRAQAQLMPDDVVVWLERSEDVERVALLDGAGQTPRSSTLPPSGGPEWARAFALVVEGLIRERPLADQETDNPTLGEACRDDGARLIDLRITERRVVHARRTRTRPWWPTAIARDGWMFRFGWTQGTTPRRDWFRIGSSQENYLSGGLRLAVGRWLHSNVRVSLVGDLAWANREPEGALGLQAMLLSQTRVRLGVGAEIAALLVSEQDLATGNRFGWVGYRLSLPLEIGIEVNRKGGFFVNLGPTWTKAPHADHHLGYQLSVEWEFN